MGGHVIEGGAQKYVREPKNSYRVTHAFLENGQKHHLLHKRDEQIFQFCMMP